MRSELGSNVPFPSGTVAKLEEAIGRDAIQKYCDLKYHPTSPFLRKINRGIKIPLKLLCLHGGGSNNDITKIQLCSIGLFQKVQLDLVHGKYKSDPGVPAFLKLSKPPFYRWFDKKINSEILCRVLISLAKTIQREGPYDGLYGFSQGSYFVSLLSSPEVARVLGIKRTWKFVINACGIYGYTKIIKKMLQQYDKKAKIPSKHSIEIPSLHLIGRRDEMRKSAESLVELFKTPSVVYHDYGHGLPRVLLQDATFQSAVNSFMTQQASGSKL